MENKTVEHTLNKVVFLDRDGTLNEEVNYLHKTGDMKLLPGVPQALKKLKDAGYKLIVVTNQAGVARPAVRKRRSPDRCFLLLPPPSGTWYWCI